MLLEYALADDQACRESLVDDWSEWRDEWLRQEEDLEWYLPENTEFSNDSW